MDGHRQALLHGGGPAPPRNCHMLMFDRRAFHTWPQILVGATLFAGLFMLIMLMAEQVLDGRFRSSRVVTGIGAGAFIGYVATAWLVRSAPSDT